VELPFLLIVGLAVVLLAALWASGLLVGRASIDTPSYFGGTRSAGLWGASRHPLYGALAVWLGATAEAPGHIALVQALLHVAAALSLYGGSRVAGLRPTGAALLSAAALVAQSALFHVPLLVPESAANAFLLLAFAGVLAASRAARLLWLLLIPIAAVTAMVYLLRPASLPAILVLPVLFFIFAKRNADRRLCLHTLCLLVAIALPFLVQAGVRQRAVGDFNIVSYGGFQMSALAGLMLRPETVTRLPASVQATAQAILAARNAGEAEGRITPTPFNSVGERSFSSAAIGYFDIYARTYDDLLREIAKLRRPGESWVAFNRRLMAFAFATVATSPLQWAAWIGGATARLAGRSLITNAVTLLALVVLGLTAVPATWRRSGLGPSAGDIAPIAVIALAWLAATGPLIVVITYPATRYIDTAGILLPAVPAVLAAAMIEGLRAGAPAGISSRA
jgi:broad specificity phosphatase PhoE